MVRYYPFWLFGLLQEAVMHNVKKKIDKMVQSWEETKSELIATENDLIQAASQCNKDIQVTRWEECE